MDDAWQPDDPQDLPDVQDPAYVERSSALVLPTPTDQRDQREQHGDAAHGWQQPSARTWIQEMPRWLATLNPGRTGREYEKALRYFFETPGVPQELGALTFDLLLAYRGALALRATPHRDAAPTPRSSDPAGPALAAARREALPGATAEGADQEGDHDGDHESGYESGYDGRAHANAGPAGPDRSSPLAPATVNLRLTALRQFLAHCALFGYLPDLSTDRLRAALRRLSVERRRPYQVLAEPEWQAFVEAARWPEAALARTAPVPPIAGSDGSEGGAVPKPAGGGLRQAGARSPWGVPRALRAATSQRAPSVTPPPIGERPRLPRSRAGLTGERTAGRDYALVGLALATGLRAIELAALDVADLTREWHAGREEWWLVLPDEKTKGQHGGRTLPLAPALIESLLTYIRASGRSWERSADHPTPLFLSERRPRGQPADQRRARLTPSQIARIVDRVEVQWLALRGGQLAADASGEDGAAASAAGETRAISPHALRHSTAIALLEGNSVTGRPPASVEHVRGWLGHLDIRTTQGYLAHLEARRHRRPFALTPVLPPSAEAPARDGEQAGNTPADTAEQGPRGGG